MIYDAKVKCLAFIFQAHRPALYKSAGFLYEIPFSGFYLVKKQLCSKHPLLKDSLEHGHFLMY
jgi:hypothetical protein